MKDFCREIIAEKYPEKLESYFSLKRKLEKGKCEVIPSVCILTPSEREVFLLLMEELVTRHENKFGSLSYLIDKFGPAALVFVAKEIMERLQ